MIDDRHVNFHTHGSDTVRQVCGRVPGTWQIFNRSLLARGQAAWGGLQGGLQPSLRVWCEDRLLRLK